MYQGHHQDGSSIQVHSAGSTYPYVVGCRENRGGPLMWFVLAPCGGSLYEDESGEVVLAFAMRLARVRANLRAMRLAAARSVS